MGETPADTEREINQLRGDMTAALNEVERRLRGGARGIATSEARIGAGRAVDNPTLIGVAGVVAVGAVAYGAYALIRGLRERQKPRNRLQRGVEQAREEISEVAERAARSLLEPAQKKLEPSHKKRGRSPVIKKFVWAALLSIFMAVGSVVARRVADAVWRAVVHEEPPTSKSKAAS
jgi:hypothetical protein